MSPKVEKEFAFDAVLLKNPDMDAAYLIVPVDIRRESGRGRLKVNALLDGVLYQGSVVNMGIKDERGEIAYVLGVPKAIRRQIGKEPGESVSVRLWEREG